MISHQLATAMSNTILVAGLLSGFTLGCSACRKVMRRSEARRMATGRWVR